MSDLEDALKKYRDTEALANLDLDAVPRNVRPGREAQKREAFNDLDRVKESYEKVLAKSLFGISVTGPGVQKFIELAIEEAAVLTVDTQEIYTRITDKVQATIGVNGGQYGGQFGVGQYSAMVQELMEIAVELDIASLPSPKWSEPVNISKEGGLLKHVRDMIDSSVGLELFQLYVKNQMLQAALEVNEDRQTVPVVLTGLTEGFDTQLLTKVFAPGRNAVVRTEKDVTKEFVLQTFTDVKKQIKAAKNPKTAANQQQTKE